MNSQSRSSPRSDDRAYMPPYVSVVVCVYNEAGNSQPLLAQLTEALQDIDYEIIYVNDGSTDRTLAELLPVVDTRLTVLDLRKNYGQSAALAAGIHQARGQFVVTLDGDQQNDPRDIPPMLRMAETEDADLVVGIRQQRQDNPLLRNFPSRVANALIRRTLGSPVLDNGCALKVIRLETAKGLDLYGELHRFIPVLAYLDGARIAQVPVRHHPRLLGRSKYGLGRTGRVLSDLVFLTFRQRYGQKPMHLFGGLGLTCLLVGFVLSGYLGLTDRSTPAALLRMLVFTGWLGMGLQFLTYGLFFELQIRTYYEAQGKKPYQVRKVYNAANPG